MERLKHLRYNDQFKKIKIDEIEISKIDNNDSFTDKIYKIAMNELENNPENLEEDEIDENIQFNKIPLEMSLSSSINSNNINSISGTNSLSQSSNSSYHSDKTKASSEFQKKYNNNINILEIPDENNEISKKKIDVTNIITGEEKRTTIEINKIPKKYNLKTIKEELNNKGFKGKYDYISFEVNDRYNNDINNSINPNCKKIYINFVDPLHIILFYYFVQKKYFNFKNNINDIQYSDFEYLTKANIYLEPNNKLKNSFNNKNQKSNLINKIEIPKEYLDFYKKVNPNDVCINSKESHFRTEVFFVKKK
jgi:hypothetical protein